jgi:hypothetical protein
MKFPILTTLSGVFFIIAGLSAFYGFSFSDFFPLVLVGGGAVVILLALTKQRPPWWSVALFVVSLIVLVSAQPAFGPITSKSYSATKSSVDAQVINLAATNSFGAITIQYSNSSVLAYEVQYKLTPSFLLPLGGSDFKLTNSTTGGVLSLRVSASYGEVVVTLGRSYLSNINASTAAGSINFRDDSGERVGKVALSSGTGTVDAIVDTSSLQSLSMTTSTGSVSLTSSSLSTQSRLVPVTLSTSFGSVSARMTIARNVAVSLSATASTGSISHNLAGFVVTQDSRAVLSATAGDVSASTRSLSISATAQTGSIDLNIQTTG